MCKTYHTRKASSAHATLLPVVRYEHKGMHLRGVRQIETDVNHQRELPHPYMPSSKLPPPLSVNSTLATSHQSASIFCQPTSWPVTTTGTTCTPVVGTGPEKQAAHSVQARSSKLCHVCEKSKYTPHDQLFAMHLSLFLKAGVYKVTAFCLPLTVDSGHSDIVHPELIWQCQSEVMAAYTQSHSGWLH